MTSASEQNFPPRSEVLRDDHLEAIVLPAHGGKIVSLIDRQTGRDWLWKNPYLPLNLPRWGASFVDAYDAGGFDECFPAVSAGPYPLDPWKDRTIPDHGEWWALSWEVTRLPSGLRLTAQMQGFPLRAERLLTLQEGTLRLEYRVENPTDHPFAFIWSAHPLLALEDGMRIEIPEGHPLEVFGSDRLGDRHTPVRWPMADGLDLATVKRTGWSAKLAGSAPERGWVGLSHEDRMLRVAYDPALVTDLGLWLNMGGWCPLPEKQPYFNLGLEPCIGWGDDLAYAVSRNLSHGVIPAQSERRWFLELAFETRRGAGSRVG